LKLDQITNDLLLDLVIVLGRNNFKSIPCIENYQRCDRCCLVLLQTQNRVVKIVVVQLYYCPFLRSLMDKHLMPSNSSELVVAPGFYSFCNDAQSEWQHLTNFNFQSSDDLQLLMTLASGRQLQIRVLLMTSASDDLQSLFSSDVFLQHKLPFCRFNCS